MFKKAPEFWKHHSFYSTLLTPVAQFYSIGKWCRTLFTVPYKASLPVICVGNVTLGGAGKTPVSLAIAQLLLSKGKCVVFLSKGYGGTHKGPVQVDPETHTATDVGDEPLLLARTAPVIVAHNRVEGAKLAGKIGADVIIMDDGLQNPTIHKDISFLVVDGIYGFGNGYVFPAGPLREPATHALDRVTAAVWIGEETTGLISLLKAKTQVIRATLVPTVTEDYSQKKCIAFAGIADPDKFFRTLQSLGATTLERIAFPDHHPYSDEDIAELLHKASTRHATLVTTEKDAVRLPPEIREKVSVIPVEITWKNVDQVNHLIQKIVP